MSRRNRLRVVAGHPSTNVGSQRRWADPELPGFDSREQLIRRYEEMIGRRLADLDWYEIFAMARMGCCILRTQVLLRSIGQGDHFLTRAPILPTWTIAAVRE